MADRQDTTDKDRPEREAFREQVDRKEKRKVAVREHGKDSVWFGLGMFGLIGWSVAIPTLLGIALGIWLDTSWPQGQLSWTLTFLVLGVCLGCLNAWYWVARERNAIHGKKGEESRAADDEQ
jgi:ATP synthase protein I